MIEKGLGIMFSAFDHKLIDLSLDPFVVRNGYRCNRSCQNDQGSRKINCPFNPERNRPSVCFPLLFFKLFPDVLKRFGLDELRIPVRRLQSVPHRMEMKKHGNVTIIDDAFNSNPIGSKAAVETLAMFDGMRILLTPGMVELGAEEAEYKGGEKVD